MPTYSNEAKPAGRMVLLALVVILVGGIVEAVVIRRSNAKRAAEAAKRQEIENRQKEAEQHAADQKAKPIYRFVDSITRPAHQEGEPAARFLKDRFIPCATVKRVLGIPDSQSTGRNGEFKTLDLSYRIDATRDALFECVYLSKEPVISEVLLNGEEISDMHWSQIVPIHHSH
jgi:hypothetical protein